MKKARRQQRQADKRKLKAGKQQVKKPAITDPSI
jgi:hypothetical protein